MSKTIDGVPRELLERLQAQTELGNDWDEVQALLAAPPAHPIIKALNDKGVMELVALRATVAQQAKMIEYLQAAPVVERQPKGALIRYREYVGIGEGGRELWHNWSDWSNTTVSFAESKLDQTRDLKSVQYEVEWLYAEQPAPVAVVAELADALQQFCEMNESDYAVRGGMSSRWQPLMDRARGALDKVKELNS